MKTSTRFDRSALGAVLLSTVLASPAAFAESKKDVPFTAQLVSGEVVYPNDGVLPNPNACPAVPGVANLIGNTVGSGTATQLGAVTFVATDCIAGVPQLFVFSKGRMTMTGANGEQLKAEYFGVMLPTATPPFYTVEGRIIFTGGTGKLSGASGYGELRGTSNIMNGQAQYRVDGKISY